MPTQIQESWKFWEKVWKIAKAMASNSSLWEEWKCEPLVEETIPFVLLSLFTQAVQHSLFVLFLSLHACIFPFYFFFQPLNFLYLTLCSPFNEINSLGTGRSRAQCVCWGEFVAEEQEAKEKSVLACFLLILSQTFSQGLGKTKWACDLWIKKGRKCIGRKARCTASKWTGVSSLEAWKGITSSPSRVPMQAQTLTPRRERISCCWIPSHRGHCSITLIFCEDRRWGPWSDMGGNCGLSSEGVVQAPREISEGPTWWYTETLKLCLW